MFTICGGWTKIWKYKSGMIAWSKKYNNLRFFMLVLCNSILWINLPNTSGTYSFRLRKIGRASWVWSWTAGPMSDLSVLGLPNHGSTVRRTLQWPFQVVLGSDSGRSPLTHDVQCGGIHSGPTLDINFGGGGCGNRGIWGVYPEDGIA